MNKLKHLIFGFALLAGLSVGVSAQRHDDQKKPPPKDPPPKVEPREKPPRGENRPKEDKPKKPGYSLVWRDETGNYALV